jgi:hypothetical protein
MAVANPASIKKTDYREIETVAMGFIAAKSVGWLSNFRLQSMHDSFDTGSDMSSCDSVMDFVEDTEVASLDERDRVLEPDIEELDGLSRLGSPRSSVVKSNGLSSSTMRPSANLLSLR